MSPLVDWYINQLATHGLARVIAAQTGLFVATWCGLGATLHTIERHRTRRSLRHLEDYANHPANRTRKEKP